MCTIVLLSKRRRYTMIYTSNVMMIKKKCKYIVIFLAIRGEIILLITDSPIYCTPIYERMDYILNMHWGKWNYSANQFENLLIMSGRFYQRVSECLLLLWRPFWGLLNWCHVFKSCQCDKFEDLALRNNIYKFPFFNYIDLMILWGRQDCVAMPPDDMLYCY